MGIIYVLENKINNKMYVGQTTQKFEIRMSKHLRGKRLIGLPEENTCNKWGNKIEGNLKTISTLLGFNIDSILKDEIEKILDERIDKQV